MSVEKKEIRKIVADVLEIEEEAIGDEDHFCHRSRHEFASDAGLYCRN
ncbi:MAG: hypothetical protein ACLR23_30020 [Clostridia bacterium]